MAANNHYDFDYIIIGSGFGGSVSALRLSEKGYKVAVIEQGRRWSPDTLPKTNWKFWDYLWNPAIGLRGFLSMRLFKHVMIVHSAAVGGGSVNYAQTLLTPPDTVWNEGSWQGLDHWQAEMPQYYATAKKMLGANENQRPALADAKLKEMAAAVGVADSYYHTQVGVFFGDPNDPPGTEYPDPYFDGSGPTRNSCIACGGCMVGCQHNAKNSLDKNYLYLAEKNGVAVISETKVVDVKPLNAKADGEDGYQVEAVNTFSKLKPKRRMLRGKNLIFAASSLGTQSLLFDLKARGSLPNISAQLGKQVRTNSESILTVRYPGCEEDYSKGIAIGSGIYIDQHTHVEAVRNPDGSNLLAGLFTILTGGRPGPTRALTWFKTLLLSFLKKPVKTLRLVSPYRAARETIMLLVMQTIDGTIDMKWTRKWYWPFKKGLSTHGEPIPTFIPEANEFAAKAAAATGGMAQSSTSEIFFNVPMTAHCMGGCAMAENAELGVIDAQHRVFGYKNMMICDGSVLGANLGVNPSLTITALTERAMSFIPDNNGA